MIRLDDRVSLYLFVQPCDMRRQMDSLMSMVAHELARPPRPGQIYIFMNRRRNTIRLLFLDAVGVCIFSKRLFKGSVGAAWASGLALDSPVLEVSAAVLTELLTPTL
jgi:hypothetical protein